MDERVKSIIKEYHSFRKLVFKQNFEMFRSNLIHVLYVLFKRIIWRYFLQSIQKEAQQKDRDQIDSIFDTMKDFYFNEHYKEECLHLHKVYKETLNKDIFKKDSILKQILLCQSQIVLSKFAQQFLASLFEERAFVLLSQIVFASEDILILESDDILTESYSGQQIIQTAFKEDFIRINQQQYTIGMLRDNYNLRLWMEEIIIKLKNPYEKNYEINLGNLFPIDKSSQNFCSNCPDYPHKYLIDLSKSYIRRENLSAENQASILEIKMKNSNNLDKEKISVVDFHQDLKAIVFGTFKGPIYSCILFEDLKQDQEFNKDAQKFFMGQGPFDTSLKSNFDFSNEKHIKKVDYIGHGSSVTALSLSFNSSYFVSGDSNGQIRLWSVLSGVCMAVYSAHIKSILKLQICQRGYYFASACSDNIIFLWATNSPNPLRVFTDHKDFITCLQFTKNMIYIVSASFDLTIRVQSIDDQNTVWVFYNQNPVTCLDTSETGQILVAGDTKNIISIWNIFKATLIKRFHFSELQIHKMSPIRGIEISYDESNIFIHNDSCLQIYKFDSIIQYIKEDTNNWETPDKYLVDVETNPCMKPFQIIFDEKKGFFQAVWSIRNVIYLFKNYQ